MGRTILAQGRGAAGALLLRAGSAFGRCLYSHGACLRRGRVVQLWAVRLPDQPAAPLPALLPGGGLRGRGGHRRRAAGTPGPAGTAMATVGRCDADRLCRGARRVSCRAVSGSRDRVCALLRGIELLLDRGVSALRLRQRRGRTSPLEQPERERLWHLPGALYLRHLAAVRAAEAGSAGRSEGLSGLCGSG